MAFWDQFEIHNGPITGGITGTPSVDPAQLQVPQIDYSKMDPNDAMRLQTEAQGYGYGGRRPDESFDQWRSRIGIGGGPMLYPGGDAPRDPSGRTFQDIFAGRSGTPPAGWQYQAPNPNEAQSLTTLSQLGQRFGSIGSPGAGGIGNAILHHVRTPDGRMVQVPDAHLAEALRRGGIRLTGGPGGAMAGAMKGFGGLF